MPRSKTKPRRALEAPEHREAPTATAGLETAPLPRINAWLGRVLARDSMKRTLADAQAAVPR